LGCGWPGAPTRSSRTSSDLLAGILEREPDWSKLPQSVSPGIHRLLRRCLQKDSQHRLRDIGDARLEIQEEIHTRSGPATVAERRLDDRGSRGYAVMGHLKPNVTRVAAREYGFEFRYQSRPSWDTYASLLEFAAQIRGDLRDLRPRDMIDLQSFIWVQGSSEY